MSILCFAVIVDFMSVQEVWEPVEIPVDTSPINPRWPVTTRVEMTVPGRRAQDRGQHRNVLVDDLSGICYFLPSPRQLCVSALPLAVATFLSPLSYWFIGMLMSALGDLSVLSVWLSMGKTAAVTSDLLLLPPLISGLWWISSSLNVLILCQWNVWRKQRPMWMFKCPISIIFFISV